MEGGSHWHLAFASALGANCCVHWQKRTQTAGGCVVCGIEPASVGFSITMWLHLHRPNLDLFILKACFLHWWVCKTCLPYELFFSIFVILSISSSCNNKDKLKWNGASPPFCRFVCAPFLCPSKPNKQLRYLLHRDSSCFVILMSSLRQKHNSFIVSFGRLEASLVVSTHCAVLWPLGLQLEKM